MSITTEKGTTVRLSEEEHGTFILLDIPDAPPSLRIVLAGRVMDDGFHPMPFQPILMGPAVLRAIADLIEAARP